MRAGELGRQVSAGVIVGLSAIVYSLSYGALLFAGPLTGYVGYGITIALITAIVGALFGWLGEEKTFIAGPDSNTISVLASMLAVLAALDLAGPLKLKLSVATIFVTALLSALGYYLVARARLSGLVRYIPFSVMAGFLAATGWLMTSGALNIIAGTPLSLAGLRNVLADPLRPELAAGVLVAIALQLLARRVAAALLIPLVMLLATLAVHLFLASGLCHSPRCAAPVWLFARVQEVQWLPPWALDWQLADLAYLVESLPAMLVVGFVGLLTVLLSMASLELAYKKEFDLNRVLRSHALAASVAAACGGFMAVISIGRTAINRQAGGGAVAGAVAASLCLAMLLGAGEAIAYVPKAALGGLVLYLGANMIRQWLWDQRHKTTPVEFGQIALILILVANYGFLIGFGAGLLISCVVFVVTYSRIPLVDLATTLALFRSAVIRPEEENDILAAQGGRTLLYRLSGYVFFGSASRIDELFQTQGAALDGVVIDFSKVSGIDSSAIGVFQRILRRYEGRPTRFYFVHAAGNEASLRAIAEGADERVAHFASLDHAVETAEQAILERCGGGNGQAAHFRFFDQAAERAVFLAHCELRRVAAGELLCAEGEQSNEIYFVEDGSLEVFKAADGAADFRVAKLHAGAMVGELAFYTGEARTASIVAVSAASVYVLQKDALARLRATHPALATRFDHMVIQRISHALTRSNTLVAMFR